MLTAEIITFAWSALVSRAYLFIFLGLLWIPCHAFWLSCLDGQVPEGIEWAVTGGTGFFRQVQSTVLSVWDLRGTLLQEYPKNRPFLVGTFLKGPMIILTRDHVPWFKDQLARSTIDFTQLQIKKLHLQYSGFEFPASLDSFNNLVRRIFTKNNQVDLFEVADEVEQSLDRYIAAKDNEWKSLPCCELVEKVITSSVNRVVVGVPLCRNEDFLSAAKAPAKIVFPIALLVACTCKLFRPIVGRTCKALADRYWKDFRQHVMPIAQKTLEESGSASKSSSASATLMTKWANAAERMPAQSKFLNVEKLPDVIILANLTAVLATSTACSLALLNVLSHPQGSKIIDDLRQEAYQLFQNGISTDNLDAMRVTDSVCRESLRLENGDLVGTRGVVVQPIETHDRILLQPGTIVTLPAEGIHRDAAIYPEDALNFDPYRFCGTTPKSSDKKELAHDISERYLAFGIGPHACPGRWFATAMTKLTLATFLRDYDIQLLEKPWQAGGRLGGFLVPPMRQQIVVRRRKAVSFDMRDESVQATSG